MADHRLRDATPFVEYLRADTRAQLSAALGFPLDLGAVPLCELAGAEQRDQVAQALASPVVEDLPATPLGDLLPTLREALVDSRFRGVAAAAERLRARLGDGPVPRGEADSAIMAVTSADHDPLDERERELLLWCAGPYRAWGDDLVLRNTRVRAP